VAGTGKVVDGLRRYRSSEPRATSGRQRTRLCADSLPRKNNRLALAGGEGADEADDGLARGDLGGEVTIRHSRDGSEERGARSIERSAERIGRHLLIVATQRWGASGGQQDS
jgi:hypothetical protein